MALQTEFKPIALEDLRREAALLKADGWRFIQTHAVNTDEGVDLYYSFMRDGLVMNLRIEGVKKNQPVPTITDLFLAAFVFENEARELFGVDMRDIAIDFQGAMYAPMESVPMTIITPEQKAAREKARKVAAAKEAKEAAGGEAASAAPAAGGTRVFKMTPELQARLDAKYPSLSDEKKAKVDAALAARKAEAESASMLTSTAKEPAVEKAVKPVDGDATASSVKTEKPVDTVLEEKIAALDDEKAAKVRAAIAKKVGGDVGVSASQVKAEMAEAPSDRIEDEQLNELISHMDEAKAAKVRAALAAKGGE